VSWHDASFDQLQLAIGIKTPKALTIHDKLLAAPRHACRASGSELDLDQAVVTAEVPHQVRRIRSARSSYGSIEVGITQSIRLFDFLLRVERKRKYATTSIVSDIR
jgi:hypothetical protein